MLLVLFIFGSLLIVHLLKNKRSVGLREVYKQYVNDLSPLYPVSEARTLVMWVFEAYLSVTRKDVLSNLPLTVIPGELEAAMGKLMAGEPVQYVLGRAPFYGRSFKVGPGILIPRNETEELVQLILNNHRGKMKVLDLGTGSGCIAITLALEWKEAEVTALDISDQALELAKVNAADLNVKLSFAKADILANGLDPGKFDLMVSNPPYVLENERNLMHPNVLNHEPSLALFVPDDNPLKFYKAILFQTKRHLNPNGYLYFEINEAFGPEVKDLMQKEGFSEIQLYKDLNGKDRVVYGKYAPP
jgi:release factor glutamine methyltransferase